MDYLEARYMQMLEMLKEYKGIADADFRKALVGCRRREILGSCDDCNLRRALGRKTDAGGCCGWDAEANVDWAITCLEELTARDKEMEVLR